MESIYKYCKSRFRKIVKPRNKMIYFHFYFRLRFVISTCSASQSRVVAAS